MLHIDPVLREACWHGLPLVLGDRAFDLLVMLAQQPGASVSTLTLQRALWHGHRVDPANLRMHVSALRKQLGREAVQTVVGRGYLLTVPVTSFMAGGASAHSGLWTGATGAAVPLPVPHDLLIGRENLMQQLESELQQHRMVCVLGPGGVGKTRVALELARRWLDKTPGLKNGVLWVDLTQQPAAGATAARICRAVANAGGLQWAAPAADPGEGQVAHHLGQVLHQANQGQPALLVLDNAEHVCDGLATLLPALLAAAPTLRVLVTSQHVLPSTTGSAGTTGQALWLQALPVPPAGADEAELRACPSVQLLLRRAQALHPQWQPPAADWPTIGALARALGGLALALELAAPRLPLLGAEALLARLSHDLQHPGAGSVAVPERQRTLRAALDWSHALLTAAEQAALRQQSVFAAPFRMDAAVRTVRIDGLDDAAIERAIQGLVEHSMLQLLPAGPHGVPVRLRLAETTRLYALQSLQDEGPDAVRACGQRHGQALAALAQQACADFLIAADAAWTARWLPDHDDFQCAFDQAYERGDADVAADIIEALVLGANITGRTEPALQRWQATRVLAEAAAPLARAKLLGWGNLAQVGGGTRLMQSAQRLQAWRLVLGEVGRRGLCVALAMHAVVCQDSGDPNTADAALAECLALEAPDWPPRLRRRCGWIALTRLAIARDDDKLLAAAGRLSTRLAAELQHQGAWREHTLVQGQQALMLRLRGRSPDAAELLAQAALTQLQLGCGLDAGRSLALQCAALAEQPEAAESVQSAAASGPQPPAGRWHQALPVAVRALALLAPYPTQILHFAEALADFAGRQGEPELAVQLLSGAAQLRQAQQLGRDRLTDQAAARAWQQVLPMLDAATLERCTRQGRELSAEALRTLALRWLTTVEGNAPGASTASGP